MTVADPAALLATASRRPVVVLDTTEFPRPVRRVVLSISPGGILEAEAPS